MVSACNTLQIVSVLCGFVAGVLIFVYTALWPVLVLAIVLFTMTFFLFGMVRITWKDNDFYRRQGGVRE